MKRRLMDLVRCPVCRGRLDLHVLSEEREEVTLPVGGRRCATFCAMHNIPLHEGINSSIQFDCRSCYSRDIRAGVLFCSTCKLLYPIIKGVPRIIRNAYKEYKQFVFCHRETIGLLEGSEEVARRLGRLEPSVFNRRSNEGFNLQWQIYQYQDKTWFKDDIELRCQEFLCSMDFKEKQLRGALVLDAGCGNGKLTAAVSHYGAEIVGMDLSRSVERAAENFRAFAKEHSPFVHFVQGNVMEPPFAEGAFDHIHSSGVLHHTPDPRRAFRSFLTLVRRGGHAYVQLYRKREPWVGIPNNVLRCLTSRMPVRFLYWLCYLMVPLHTAAVLVVAYLRREKSTIRLANRRERALSLFDNYSPRYQYRYTPDQVRKMFEDAGLHHVKDTTLANEARHMVAFVGEKS